MSQEVSRRFSQISGVPQTQFKGLRVSNSSILGSFSLFCSLRRSSFRLPSSVSIQSCHDKLIELFSEKLYLIGLAALVVAVIMVSVLSHDEDLGPSNRSPAVASSGL